MNNDREIIESALTELATHDERTAAGTPTESTRWHPVWTWLEDPDDPESTIHDLYHAGCDLTISTGNAATVEYHCEVQHEVANGGWDQFDLPLGWALVKVSHFQSRGLDWVEWDVEIEVEPMTAGRN